MSPGGILFLIEKGFAEEYDGRDRRSIFIFPKIHNPSIPKSRTLLLSDSASISAYDTKTGAITTVCDLPENGVFCAGVYILTRTEDGVSVIAKLP